MIASRALPPPAGEGARQRPPLRGQFDARVPEPPPVAPRFLVHVGLGLRRLTPFAHWMQVVPAAGASIDHGLDVVAGPGVTGAELAPRAGRRSILDTSNVQRL
jgi:hypothetical protein